MHALHARLPKHFVLEERLERYADAIEPDPYDWKGRWAEACHPLDPARPGARFGRICLDLGCGKGTFTVECARRDPDTLFIGMDYEPICIAYAAQHAIESGLANVVFVPGNGDRIREMFEPGELDGIYINFPTPHPKKKHAAERLTYLDRLVTYADLLGPGAAITFKTDSQPLYLFSLTQFELAGYDALWQSEDVEALRPNDPHTGYEDRLTAQGARVYGICAVPRADRPAHPAQTAELSLPRYLPDDLGELDGYVPHGMEGTVANLRNWRAKHPGESGADPEGVPQQGEHGSL